MAIVERGNVVLTVKDEEVARYLILGYNEVDEKGNVVQATVPNDLGQLQALYKQQLTEIETLKAEIAKLKAVSSDEEKPKRRTKKVDAE